MTLNFPTDDNSLDESIISELQRAFQTIERLVYDGLHHGHFQYSIKCSVGRNLRRELVIEAGVSHKFTVPMDQISR
jgi:hypothetical protein